jgi:carboxylate-amine ligase
VRYEIIVEEIQMVARSLLIFGLHVHVGVSDPDRAIHIMNAARYFLPHMLALSTSSPFWLGHNTGLKSYRSEVFKKFPRTDIPDHFDSHSSFQRYVELLIKTGCIDNGKRFTGMCARTRFSRRSNFASAIFRRALTTPSPSPRSFKPSSPNSAN